MLLLSSPRATGTTPQRAAYGAARRAISSANGLAKLHQAARHLLHHAGLGARDRCAPPRPLAMPRLLAGIVGVQQPLPALVVVAGPAHDPALRHHGVELVRRRRGRS